MSDERPAEAIGNIMGDMPNGDKVNIWVRRESVSYNDEGKVMSADLDEFFESYDLFLLERAKRLEELPPEESPEGQAVRRAAPRGDARPAASQRRSQRPARKGTGLFCEDHPRVEVIETKKEWQEFDDDGNPDKFFCPGKENGTGENHQIFRRQTLARATSVPLPDGMADGPPIDLEGAESF